MGNAPSSTTVASTEGGCSTETQVFGKIGIQLDFGLADSLTGILSLAHALFTIIAPQAVAARPPESCERVLRGMHILAAHSCMLGGARTHPRARAPGFSPQNAVKGPRALAGITARASAGASCLPRRRGGSVPSVPANGGRGARPRERTALLDHIALERVLGRGRAVCCVPRRWQWHWRSLPDKSCGAGV